MSTATNDTTVPTPPSAAGASAPTQNIRSLGLSKADQTKAAFRRLTLDQWNKIEIKLDGFMMEVVNMMIRLGKMDMSKTSTSFDIESCGEEVYLTVIRPLLVEDHILRTLEESKEESKAVESGKKKKGKKGGKKGKNPNKLSKEQIIQQNKARKIRDHLNEIMGLLRGTNFKAQRGFTSRYVEFRIVTLMYCIKRLSQERRISELDAYELIIGAKKVLNVVNRIEDVSTTICRDLEKMVRKLVRQVGFSIQIMFERYPRLVISTKYDTILPITDISPYNSQVELMTALVTPNPGFYLYKAMIGSGKTTTALSIASYIQELRRQHHYVIGLFICSVEPVRHQVGRLLWNGKIPFAVASTESHGVRITNHFSCKKDEDRIMIISDLATGLYLLKERAHEYILFLDEPTIGADQETSVVTNLVSEIMLNTPPKTIWSSATLPEPDEMTDITGVFTDLYPEGEIHQVRSMESLIGCEIKTFDGNIIAPHTDCTSTDEVESVISQIQIEPFIQRLYTAPTLYHLTARLEENNVEGVPDLNQHFFDVNMMNQQQVQNMAITLLTLLKECDSEVITNVCRHVQPSVPASEEKGDDLGFDWDYGTEGTDEDSTEGQEAKVDESVDIKSTLLTTDAHKYMGGALYAVVDPIETAEQLYNTLMDGVPSATDLVARYKRDLAKFKERIERLESKSSKKGSDDEVMNRDQRAMRAQEMVEGEAPHIEFPECYQINTRKHIAQFVPEEKCGNIDISLIRQPFVLESIPVDDFGVPDWIELLLFAGVGVYAPTSQCMDKKYTDYILSLAAEGRLAFLISDSSISYGANYPLSNVLIDDDLAEQHSVGTIMQLMGRAGRVGQSWAAHAHIGSRTGQLLIRFIKGTETTGVSTEAANMCRTLVSIRQQIEYERTEGERLRMEKQEYLDQVTARIKQERAEAKADRERIQAEMERKEKEERDRRNQRSYNRSSRYGNRRDSRDSGRSERGNWSHSERVPTSNNAWRPKSMTNRQSTTDASRDQRTTRKA